MSATLPPPVRLAFTHYPSENGGDAAPLVVAHGLFGSGRNWTSLAKKLAADRPVYSVDLRNHGESPWDARMDYPAMASDLLAFAAEEIGEPALFLGHSMGGKAVMAAALSAPDQVLGAIVADIAPVAYAHSQGVYLAAMRGVDLSAVRRRGDAEPMLAVAVPEPDLRAFILQNLTISSQGARWRLNLDALDHGMAQILGWPDSLNTAAYPGQAFFLHGGASDYVTPAAETAVRARFPNATIDSLPGAGHWLHAEQPRPFVDRVLRWLREAAL